MTPNRQSVGFSLVAAGAIAAAAFAVPGVAGAQRAPRTQSAQPLTMRGIAIDMRMAEDLGLRVGSIVRVSASPGVSGDSVRIDAIVERRADPSEVARSEYRVRLHLPHLQELLALDDRVDRFAVSVDTSAYGGAGADSVVRRINDVAFGFRAHRSRDVAVGSSRTFQVVERFHRAIGSITVVASAVFLLCLLLLTVEERKRDIAALRLMGISQATIVRAIVIEAAIVSLVGSALGALIGWVASMLVNAHYQAVYRTPLLFALITPGILGFAVTLSLVLGVAAGALAAWRLVRTPPLALLGR